MRQTNSAIAVAFVIWSSLTPAVAAQDVGCVPLYSEVVNRIGPIGGVMRVVIPPERFTVAAVQCAIRDLKTRHPEWARKKVGVQVFSDDAAAGQFEIMNPMVVSTRDPGRGLRALYTVDEEGRNEVFTLNPAGFGGGRAYDSDIGLTSSTSPNCRIAVSGRCLVETRLVEYPQLASQRNLEGRINVIGSIGPDGVTRVNRIESDATYSPPSVVLRDATEAVVASWRFEPSDHTNDFSVSFTYVIDRDFVTDPPSYDAGAFQDDHSFVRVEFELPRRITIRGTPARR